MLPAALPRVAYGEGLDKRAVHVQRNAIACDDFALGERKAKFRRAQESIFAGIHPPVWPQCRK